MTWCGKKKPGKIRLNGCRFPVIPAKAGIQGHRAVAVALDPRFRGGDEERDAYPAGKGKHMQKHVVWLWAVGFFGLLAAADAQTPSPPAATTEFDGTYAFVSSAKVNETYYAWGSTRIGQCGDLSPRGPLTIVNGHARYNRQEGTVGPQGELRMRRDPSPLANGAGIQVLR
jgi:hypothetical protein